MHERSSLPKIRQLVVLSAISVIRPSSNQAPKIPRVTLALSGAKIAILIMPTCPTDTNTN